LLPISEVEIGTWSSDFGSCQLPISEAMNILNSTLSKSIPTLTLPNLCGIIISVRVNLPDRVASTTWSPLDEGGTYMDRQNYHAKDVKIYGEIKEYLDKGIGPTGFALYSWYKCFYNPRIGGIQLSLKRIHNATGISPTTIIKYNKILKNAGLIQIKKRRPNLYIPKELDGHYSFPPLAIL